MVGEYVDQDSGRKDDRSDYQPMVEAARAGMFDVVVVQFLDRFGRRPKELLPRIKESERTSQRVRANMDSAVRKGVHPARAPYGWVGVRGPVDPIERSERDN